MSNETLAVLQKISAALEAIAAQSCAANRRGDIKLGFGQSPRPQHIYCNRKNGGLWYRLNFDSATPEPIIIEQTALTGYFKGISFSKKDFRNKDVFKVVLHVEADQPYLLESGHDTVFTKNLFMSIASMTPDELRQPLTIEVKPGDTESVLFCTVFHPGGRPVVVDKEQFGADDVRSLAEKAVHNLREAWQK